MKFRFSVLLFAFAVAACVSAQAQWMTDYNSALKQAQAEDKAVLVNFTGSDWCSVCANLKKEVFDTDEFKAFASEYLVLVEVDFPRKKDQSTDLKVKNKRMKEKFEVEGYPTIFIMDKEGNKLAKTSYAPGGPAQYVARFKTIPGFPVRTVEAPSVPPTEPTDVTKQPEEPAYAVAAPVIRYDKIALKGISGGRTKFALINNQSLSAGEKGKVKVGDKSVEVMVKEIREASVLVHIEGEPEPRELTLK